MSGCDTPSDAVAAAALAAPTQIDSPFDTAAPQTHPATEAKQGQPQVHASATEAGVSQLQAHATTASPALFPQNPCPTECTAGESFAHTSNALLPNRGYHVSGPSRTDIANRHRALLHDQEPRGLQELAHGEHSSHGCLALPNGFPAASSLCGQRELAGPPEKLHPPAIRVPQMLSGERDRGLDAVHPRRNAERNQRLVGSMPLQSPVPSGDRLLRNAAGGAPADDAGRSSSGELDIRRVKEKENTPRNPSRNYPSSNHPTLIRTARGLREGEVPSKI